MGKSLTTPLEDATMHKFLNVIILTHLTAIIAPDSKSNVPDSITNCHANNDITDSQNNGNVDQTKQTCQ